MKEQGKQKIDARCALSIPKIWWNNHLFDHIDGFEIFLMLGFQFQVILPYLKRGQLPNSHHYLGVVIIAPVDCLKTMYVSDFQGI